MISVIIPVYNRASIINRTIMNILEQTYTDFEIIVVDDGSSDNIEEVISKIKDTRVRFIKSDTNQGACHARNIGVSNASGEYIAFQDSDDLWDSRKLELQLKCLKSNNADICFCRMKDIYSNGKEKEYHSKGFSQNDVTLANELSCNFISTQLILGKKSCFEQEIFDERFPRFQDWDLGIRLVKKYQIIFLDQVLATRLVQGDSLSNNYKKGYIGGKLLLNKYKTDYEVYPKSEADFLCFYAQFQEMEDESSHSNLKKALKEKFSIKIFAKYITQLCGLYRVYLKKFS